MLKNEILANINLDKTSKGIIGDLNNIILEEKDESGKGKFDHFKKCKKCLEDKRYNKIVFIAGASLKNKIDKVDFLEEAIKNKEIFLAPACEDADWFILKYAKKWDYDILSNDKFKEYWAEYGKKWIINKRKTFMIINGELLIKLK